MIFILLIGAVILIIIKISTPKIKGFIGELKVNARLNFLGADYIVLKNIMLKNSTGCTSQIDHVVLSEYGIFVIETKNYDGWIFGSDNAEKWTQVLYKEKHSFRNPIKQNRSHIYALKSVLSDFPNIPYYSIVVFSEKATLKQTKFSVPVVYFKNLNFTIRRYSTEKCISYDDILKIQSIIKTANITDKNIRKEHIKNIKNHTEEQESKKENLFCPKCNGTLVLRNGKYGNFYGCSNYPQCRFTMSL